MRFDMENTYVGLLQLPRGIVCKNDTLGKLFPTSINGVTVGIQMPVIAEMEDNAYGILRAAPAGIQYDIDWGYGIRFPNKTSLIKATSILFKGTQEQANSIYLNFHKWLDRFLMLIKMYPYDFYKETISEEIQISDNGIHDKKTGLLLNQLCDGKWKYVRNPDNCIMAKIDKNIDNEGFSSNELSRILNTAGNKETFSLTYCFLSEACGAYQRGDNRGCVVFAGTALEYGIIHRVKKYCREHNISFIRLGTLGNKFRELEKLGIEIPIGEYRSKIVNFRNDVVHRGKNVTDVEAKRFWDNCSYLIKAFDNDILSDEDDEEL